MVTGPAQPVYDASGGHPCLDFVNSVDRTLGKPWVDRLTDYGAFLRWCAEAGTLPAARAASLARAARRSPKAAGAALARVRALREATYRIFAALAAGEAPAPDDLELLNAELALALSRLRIEPGAGGYAWRFRDDPDELVAPLRPLVRSAAQLLTSSERELVKRCASATCLWLFLDRTRNHARRWCDMKVCGNRDKVRRHRRRARTGSIRRRKT